MITGIYQIRNRVNCKRYIGSASGVDGVYSRFYDHIRELRQNKHHNQALQEDFNFFGIDNFSFEFIEECKAEDCATRETLYLRIQYPEYNVHRQAHIKLRKLPWQKSKLTPEIVNEIRTNPRHLKQYELAKEFNIASSTVSKIKRHRQWKFTENIQ